MKRAGWLVGCLSVAVAATWSTEARACGGLFCDNGPQPMPVDQTGENILFIIENNRVEAHIQIQYTGEAPRFSWVLPLTAVPTFSVGSQMFIDELLRVSVPRYGNQVTTDTCAEGLIPSPGMGASASERDAAGGGNQSTGPEVLYRNTVGAYDITVLRGGTADEVMTWLNDNNYVQLPGTRPIIDDYLTENYVFAALKLTRGAGVDEIHPLVVSYAGSVPCVPLKLTRVAAANDMGVRAFFLGSHRVVPRRYKHLEVNPLRIDWINTGSNYRDVLSHAANDPIAGGQAFVTEFAGDTSANVLGAQNALTTSNFFGTSWNSAPLRTVAVTEIVNTLIAQQLMLCEAPACTYSHPLLRPLLDEYLPVPFGMTDVQFYGCLSCNAAQIDTASWNQAAFADKFEERIVGPGSHARDLALAHPYLTRLFTLISPDEMTVDPEFHERADLPDVPAVRRSTQRLRCDGTSVVSLPDGREVALGSGNTWPTWSDDMPWAELIQDIPQTGDIVTLVDNKDAINTQLSTYNSTQRRTGRCACATPGPLAPTLSGVILLGFALSRARRRK